MELIDSAIKRTDGRYIHDMLIQELAASLKVREGCGMRLSHLALCRSVGFTSLALDPLRDVIGELSLVCDSD